MNNKKNYLVSSILMLIGAICFAVVTYANFYKGNNPLGFLFLIATACDIVASILNYRNYRNNNK